MRIITLLCSICFSLTVFTQDYDFGKISKEELSELFNPRDSSASATYLYKYRATRFEYYKDDGFQLITEVHERVKIYNQEGFEYATKAINLFKSGSDDEVLNGLKAYTYNLVDGKIVETKLDKSGIFKTEKSKYRNETKFTLPNIKVGSVVEYRYRIFSPFYQNIDDYIFQSNIPINKLNFKFEAPEYFKFKLNMKGFLSVIPEKEIRRDNLRIGSTAIDFNKECFEYNLVNVPALKEEPYVDNINNYRSTISYELSYTQFPESVPKYYSTTWEDVVKTIFDSSSFGEQLDKTGYFEEDIDAIINSISDPAKRVSLIFDFVKSRVKWNGYYSYYTDQGVKNAFKDQVGNVAEINLMLTSMLRYAGLRAYPVLVSTRENGIPLFPTREGYNYVVSYVKLPEGNIMLDATNKYSIPNVLPFRALNWQGRVISEQGGSELIDLYPSQKSENNIIMMANLDSNGNIEGGYRSIKTNHNALSFRERYIDADKDDYLEKLENRYNGIEVSDYEVKNENDLFEDVMESYKFLKENQVDIIGDKLYFSPMFFLKTVENPFKLEKREFPVDFGYPSTTSFRIIINLPEGYKLESLPEPQVLMMPDGLGVFKYNITGNDKNIQLSIESEINQSKILPSYYDILKAYFGQLVEKESEQIVLTRI